MKKERILVVVVLIVSFLVTGCSNGTENQEIRKKVQQLEENQEEMQKKIEELEKKLQEEKLQEEKSKKEELKEISCNIWQVGLFNIKLSEDLQKAIEPGAPLRVNAKKVKETLKTLSPDFYISKTGIKNVKITRHAAPSAGRELAKDEDSSIFIFHDEYLTEVQDTIVYEISYEENSTAKTKFFAVEVQIE